MVAVANLLAAAAVVATPTLERERLPVLPARGLAQETTAGVALQTLGGRWLGLLRGLHVDPDRAVAHQLVLHDAHGDLFLVDRYARKVRRFFAGVSGLPGCRLTDARLHEELHVCRRVVWLAVYGRAGSRPALRAVARAPGRIGHWQWAAFAPGRAAVLAQWSAECEAPVAYLAADGRVRAYGGESVALGWLPNGDALIHFPNGPCGATTRARGIYAVPRRGEPRLLLRTARFASYAMWGG